MIYKKKTFFSVELIKDKIILNKVPTNLGQYRVCG